MNNNPYWNYTLPFNFVKIRVPWTNWFVENNISIIERNYSKFPNKNKWNCNCHVIHDYDEDVELVDYNFLRTNYHNFIFTFLKRLKIYNNFFLSDIWYNYYKEDQYQEPHTHESTLTVVHYLILDETHPRTTFTDYNIQSNSIEVKQGDLIIFPGWYEHEVLANKTEIPRLTTAFGVTLIS